MAATALDRPQRALAQAALVDCPSEIALMGEAGEVASGPDTSPNIEEHMTLH